MVAVVELECWVVSFNGLEVPEPYIPDLLGQCKIPNPRLRRPSILPRPRTSHIVTQTMVLRAPGSTSSSNCLHKQADKNSGAPLITCRHAWQWMQLVGRWRFSSGMPKWSRRRLSGLQLLTITQRIAPVYASNNNARGRDTSKAWACRSRYDMPSA